MINQKEKLKLILADAKLFIIRRPILKRAALAVLATFPALRSRLKQAKLVASGVQKSQPRIATELSHLSPHARRIYADLKLVRESRRKESDECGS